MSRFANLEFGQESAGAPRRKATMRNWVSFIAICGMSLCSIGAEPDKLSFWSEGDALRLTLTIVEPLTNDLQQLRLELKVTNTAPTNLVLDKDLLVGFGLRFRTDKTEDFIFSEKRDVASSEVSRLDKPPTNAVLDRFVTLKPGDSLSRLFDLSKPVRAAVSGHTTDLNRAHRGFYHEAMTQYQVPASASKLYVDAWYERGVWMFATTQFKNWHGKSVDEIGLWRGRAHSNTIIIEKRRNGSN